MSDRRPGAPGSTRGSRLAGSLLAGGLVLLGAGAVGWQDLADATPDVGTVPVALAPSSAAPLPASSAAQLSTPVPPLSQPPTRLQAPAVGIDAPVTPVDVLDGGALAVPEDPDVLGWWQGGARPGDRQGTVVVDGHVDSASSGPGALFPLRDLQPGDPLELTTAVGVQGYVVQAVTTYGKEALPTDVFAVTGEPRLVVITCGGPFDRATRQYLDNVVVYAVPS